jgi:hypothetical protein
MLLHDDVYHGLPDLHRLLTCPVQLVLPVQQVVVLVRLVNLHT